MRAVSRVCLAAPAGAQTAGGQGSAVGIGPVPAISGKGSNGTGVSAGGGTVFLQRRDGTGPSFLYQSGGETTQVRPIDAATNSRANLFLNGDQRRRLHDRGQPPARFRVRPWR